MRSFMPRSGLLCSTSVLLTLLGAGVVTPLVLPQHAAAQNTAAAKHPAESPGAHVVAQAVATMPTINNIPVYPRMVTDMSGTSVALDKSAARIADLWFAHNEITVMLGGAERIKVTADKPVDLPWLFKIAPVLHTAETGIRPESANPEDLLSRQIGLVFVPTHAKAEELRRTGLPTLDAHYITLPQMLTSVDMTADALATPYAHLIAHQYREKLDGVQHLLQTRTASLPASARPRVLHIARLNPLQIDGKDTLIDAWLQAAGGRNAAAEVSGNHRPVTFEQIAAWNPDMIMIGANAGPLAADSPLRTLTAFRQGKVWTNPQGVFPWDRYGCEVLLQLEWAAQHIQPNLFKDIDLRQDLKTFYTQFFRYALTDDDVTRILAGQPPATP
ncbi:TroA family protein [Acetobacter orleanensis]|nr:ABC transporter substrate-binding protein [Acetobacter orleanensis]PCD79776.1 sugar ABC transporter substrate-binding protein [Acetobacter orleanensis]